MAPRKNGRAVDMSKVPGSWVLFATTTEKHLAKIFIDILSEDSDALSLYKHYLSCCEYAYRL